MIRKNEDCVGGTFEVIAPLSESFKDSRKLFVIDLVIEFCWHHTARVEGDWMNSTIVWGYLGNDSCDHIVVCIHFDNNGVCGVEMCEDPPNMVWPTYTKTINHNSPLHMSLIHDT